MGTAWSSLDWYDTPHWYDVVFDEDTTREADFLEALFEEFAGTRQRRVLEPACGSGRMLVELARRGWRATGFDASRPMLDYARERLAEAGLRARLLEARMEDFRIRGRFDLAHCMVSTFKYLLDEESARSHLECVAQHLVPGGIYVLGLHLTDYARASKSRERWVARRGATRVVCNIQGWPADRRRRLERVRSRLVVEEPAGERRSETEWRFRTYDARQLERLIASVPAFEHVATSDMAYEPDFRRELGDDQLDVVLVLRKRA